MPIYDYVCPKCSEGDEYFLPMSHEAPVCEKCGVEMSKMISMASFHLKGGGWAKDGYSSRYANTGAGYKPGEALKKATEGAKQDLSDTMDSLDKKSKVK